MLNKTIQGWTIIAQEHKPSMGAYLIMAMRRNHAGEFDYVTAYVYNPEMDSEWFWGEYAGSHFKSGIVGAAENFAGRLAS